MYIIFIIDSGNAYMHYFYDNEGGGGYAVLASKAIFRGEHTVFIVTQ